MKAVGTARQAGGRLLDKRVRAKRLGGNGTATSCRPNLRVCRTSALQYPWKQKSGASKCAASSVKTQSVSGAAFHRFCSIRPAPAAALKSCLSALIPFSSSI